MAKRGVTEERRARDLAKDGWGALMTLAMLAGCSVEPTSDDLAEHEATAAPTLAPAPAFSPTLTAPAECRGLNLRATRLALRIVVAFDRSGSMGSAGKWDAATAGLSTFLEAQQAGVSASLAFFPQAPKTCGGDFVTPAVPMTALPSSSFRAEFAKTKLLPGTPMRPALEGALQYARTVRANVGTEPARVVVALVTDGAPSTGTCANNTVDAVASVAKQAVADSDIVTFAVGMDGAQQESLDTIAAAGGSGAALMIDATHGAVQLAQAFEGIRRRFSCDVALPPPPAGGSAVRPDQVNVILDNVTLSYSADCAEPQGWRYDDPAKPTRIALCQDACGRASGSEGVEIKLGCPTKTAPR